MSSHPDNDMRKALVRALQEHAGAAPHVGETTEAVDVDGALCVRCRQEPRMNDRGICRRCLDEIRASVGIRTTRSIEPRPRGSPLL